jgi:glycosyltransferase involved in cell wall biosynthesis
MSIINLYLIDMSSASNTSGVDRYVSTLISGLQNIMDIHVHWIHLRNDDMLLFPKEEKTTHYTKFSIPLPQQYNTIIAERFWIRKYNKQVYRLTKHLFDGKENCIIHLHTLNLIDLAVYIRELTGCKIITHLHCIPWKGLYNRDKKRFNKLYELTYTNKNKVEKPNPEIYLTNNCELQSYVAPDALICGTYCGIDFLNECIGNVTSNTFVIPNGGIDICDDLSRKYEKKSDENFNFLFVATVNESKGIFYILQALQLIQNKGYKASLVIAGKYPPGFKERIEQDYPTLNVTVLGLVGIEELKKLYIENDFGVIGSLQEQASYTGVEMSMFAMPIITTNVDGLDEMFTDEVNALKVQTRFSSVYGGLSVDVEIMANKMIRLINDKSLRKRIGQNARKLYEQKLNLELMINKTVDVYRELIQK